MRPGDVPLRSDDGHARQRSVPRAWPPARQTNGCQAELAISRDLSRQRQKALDFTPTKLERARASLSPAPGPQLTAPPPSARSRAGIVVQASPEGTDARQAALQGLGSGPALRARPEYTDAHPAIPRGTGGGSALQTLPRDLDIRPAALTPQQTSQDVMLCVLRSFYAGGPEEKFTGNHLEYPMFKHRFRQSVLNLVSDPGSRFNILLNLTDGRAKRQIKHYAMCKNYEEALTKALDRLDRVYGNAPALVHNQLARLHVTTKVRDTAESYEDLLADLHSCRTVLESFGQQSALDQGVNLRPIWMRFSTYLRRRYHKRVGGGAPTYAALIDLVEEEYDRKLDYVGHWAAQDDAEKRGGGGDKKASRSKHVKANVATGRKRASPKGEKVRTEDGERPPKRTSLDDPPGGVTAYENAATVAHAPPPASWVCRLCQGTHQRLDQCPRYVNADSDQRYSMTKDSRNCFGCLAPGHRINDCPQYDALRCGVDGCDRRHHPTLHYYYSTRQPPAPRAGAPPFNPRQRAGAANGQPPPR